MKTILVVSDNLLVRDVASRALEPLDYEVMFCPGPLGPTYVCIAGRGGRCPLAVDADAVILDAGLMSDQMPQGTPAWRLLHYYLGLGKPVVLLRSEELTELETSEAVAVLSPPYSPETFAVVVEAICGRKPAESRTNPAAPVHVRTTWS